MIYETFNPSKHDSRKVAKLIYDVDFRTFDLLFKSSDKAISTIEKQLKKEESFDDTKVVLDENNNVILVGNPLHNKKIEKMFYKIVEDKLGKPQ